MSVYISYVLFVLGIIMIVKGSDWFVDSAVWVAKISGIPEVVIGATIVSICTTLPETLVAVTAAVENEVGMVVGNSLGSIAANTGLILAVMFLFSKETTVTPRTYQRNGFFLVIILLFAWGIGIYSGQFNRLTALVFLGLLVFFLYNNLMGAKKSMALQEKIDIENAEVSKKEKATPKQISKNTIFFLLGLVLVIGGARLVVDNGITIAVNLGIPTIVIAIIFTSLGTSLPELITAISAIKRGAIQLGMGNILGADILNLLQVIGFSALITPVDLLGDKSILYFQFPAVIVLSIIAVFLNWKGEKHLQKISGIMLFSLYLLFLVVNIFREATPFIGKWIF